MKSANGINLTMLCDFYELTMGNGYFADGMQEVVTTLRMVIEKQGAPRSIDLALTGFWFCSFAGSLLSAFISALITLFGKRN